MLVYRNFFPHLDINTYVYTNSWFVTTQGYIFWPFPPPPTDMWYLQPLVVLAIPRVVARTTEPMAGFLKVGICIDVET